ncbi:MAG TPA: metallophosphoesterase [Solirubrobacteraceae bacterium]|nr:metallophosphoesterase [Solirubrobacteraceae bacterium]
MARTRRSRRRAIGGGVAAAVAAAVVLVAVRPWESAPPVRAPAGGDVPSGPARRAVVWAVGDGADGGAAAKAVARRVRAGPVDRFLYLGDVYGPQPIAFLRGDGSASDYRTRYAPVYGALAPITAPTPGNHEWPRRGDGYEPYWRRVMGRTPPAYYTFSIGGWQILSLNSEAPHGRGSPQVRWLARQVARPGTCRLAFWHRPRFSAGRHGDQPDVAPLWDAVRGRAALVVNGHDHDMQRLRPIGGTTELVSGAGGHGHYELHPDARRLFGDDRTYGALRIDLRPGHARLRFVAAGGRVLDSSAVRCRQAPSA